jgi:hypothetical protein
MSMINLGRTRGSGFSLVNDLEADTHSPPMSGIVGCKACHLRCYLLLPGEDGRDGIVPDRSDDDAWPGRRATRTRS